MNRTSVNAVTKCTAWQYIKNALNLIVRKLAQHKIVARAHFERTTPERTKKNSTFRKDANK